MLREACSSAARACASIRLSTRPARPERLTQWHRCSLWEVSDPVLRHPGGRVLHRIHAERLRHWQMRVPVPHALTSGFFARHAPTSQPFQGPHMATLIVFSHLR